MVFAKDGAALVTGGEDRLLKVWDVGGESRSGQQQLRGTKMFGGAADGARGGQGGDEGRLVQEWPPHQSFVGHPGVVKGVRGSGLGVLGGSRCCARLGGCCGSWR